MNIPNSSFSIGQRVYFKSIHGEFDLNYQPATIIGLHLHEKVSVEFPDAIALHIQFDDLSKYYQTWTRTDEVFPLT